MPLQSTLDKREEHGVSLRFAEAAELAGYAHYMLMRGQLAGSMTSDGHVVTEEERAIAAKCRTLSENIRKRLSKSRVDEIALLLDCYDIVYRLGFSQMPDMAYIDNQKRCIFEAWKSGDKLIEESVVFGIVSTALRQDNTKVDLEYKETYRTLKTEWLATLQRYNYFPQAIAYENYQRLALIMRESLSEHCKYERSAKQKWYEYNKVDDLSHLSTQILRSYRRFTTALFPDVIDYESQQFLDNRILTELSTRHDLDPYDREAFRLALAYINS